MKPKLFIFIAIFTFIPQIFAQQKIPVVKASSVFVSVKDGDTIFNEEWIVGEGTSAKPEVYVPIKSEGNKKITFITDIDSITFDTKPNGKYLFIIEYKSAKVFTQIDRSESLTPTLRKGITFSRSCKNCADKPNTIPFTIDGKNNGILIQGKINNSETLNLVFDTGAKFVYASKSAIGKKINLTLNGTINDVGGDGVTKLETSSGNRLTIGDMAWKNLDIITFESGDAVGIIGWNVFESKPIEIDYDKKLITIHDAPATISKDYTKHKMEIFNGSPFIEATLIVGDKQVTDWFLFDSGFNGSLILSNHLAVKNGLIGTMRIVGKGITIGSGGGEKKIQSVLVPKMLIGNYEVKDIRAAMNADQPDDVPHDDILGNELLKRFNVVLDFRNKNIYLKPNSLFKATMKK